MADPYAEFGGSADADPYAEFGGSVSVAPVAMHAPTDLEPVPQLVPSHGPAPQGAVVPRMLEAAGERETGYLKSQAAALNPVKSPTIQGFAQEQPTWNPQTNQWEMPPIGGPSTASVGEILRSIAKGDPISAAVSAVAGNIDQFPDWMKNLALKQKVPESFAQMGIDAFNTYQMMGHGPEVNAVPTSEAFVRGAARTANVARESLPVAGLSAGGGIGTYVGHHVAGVPGGIVGGGVGAEIGARIGNALHDLIPEVPGEAFGKEAGADAIPEYDGPVSSSIYQAIKNKNPHLTDTQIRGLAYQIDQAAGVTVPGKTRGGIYTPPPEAATAGGAPPAPPEAPPEAAPTAPATPPPTAPAAAPEATAPPAESSLAAEARTAAYEDLGRGGTTWQKGAPPAPEGVAAAAPPATVSPVPAAPEEPAAQPEGPNLYRPMLRPASFATLPRGLGWDYVEAPTQEIANRRGLPLSDSPHGVISTDRPLTADEMEHFDLQPVEPSKPAEAAPAAPAKIEPPATPAAAAPEAAPAVPPSEVAKPGARPPRSAYPSRNWVAQNIYNFRDVAHAKEVLGPDSWQEHVDRYYAAIDRGRQEAIESVPKTDQAELRSRGIDPTGMTYAQAQEALRGKPAPAAEAAPGLTEQLKGSLEKTPPVAEAAPEAPATAAPEQQQPVGDAIDEKIPPEQFPDLNKSVRAKVQFYTDKGDLDSAARVLEEATPDIPAARSISDALSGRLNTRFTQERLDAAIDSLNKKITGGGTQAATLPGMLAKGLSTIPELYEIAGNAFERLAKAGMATYETFAKAMAKYGKATKPYIDTLWDSLSERFASDKATKGGLMPGMRTLAPVDPATLPDKPLILTGKKVANPSAQLDNIDTVLAQHPNPTASTGAWNTMMAHALADNDVPIPPYNAIKMLNTDGIYEQLSRNKPKGKSQIEGTGLRMVMRSANSTAMA